MLFRIVPRLLLILLHHTYVHTVLQNRGALQAVLQMHEAEHVAVKQRSCRPKLYARYYIHLHYTQPPSHHRVRETQSQKLMYMARKHQDAHVQMIHISHTLQQCPHHQTPCRQGLTDGNTNNDTPQPCSYQHSNKSYNT